VAPKALHTIIHMHSHNYNTQGIGILSHTKPTSSYKTKLAHIQYTCSFVYN